MVHTVQFSLYPPGSKQFASSWEQQLGWGDLFRVCLPFESSRKQVLASVNSLSWQNCKVNTISYQYCTVHSLDKLVLLGVAARHKLSCCLLLATCAFRSTHLKRFPPNHENSELSKGLGLATTLQWFHRCGSAEDLRYDTVNLLNNPALILTDMRKDSTECPNLPYAHSLPLHFKL